MNLAHAHSILAFPFAVVRFANNGDVVAAIRSVTENAATIDSVVAVVRHAEEAAMLVAALGDAHGVVHSAEDGLYPSWVLWCEGAEDVAAGDSYDATAETINRRLNGLLARAKAGVHVGVSR